MIIAFDFDGTVVEDTYPKIGEPKIEVIENLKKHQQDGDKLILWTCRSGQLLKDAVNFLIKHNLEPDAVNDNLDEIKLKGLLSRKVYADIYLDDKAKTTL